MTADPAALSRGWAPRQKLGTLRQLQSAVARDAIIAAHANAAELAASIDPSFVVTPALDLIAGFAEVAINRPSRNLLITMPPQEGKSTLCAVWVPLRALQRNANRRIILSTYGDTLAEDHSRTCRELITRHGTGVIDPLTGAVVEDKLGLRLASGVKASRVSSWKIDGGSGGMIAVGMGSAISGRPADLFIIDDPYKNMIEADSVTHRRKVEEWFSSVVLTRLSPSASIILIQTRWHPEDLAGTILAGQAKLDPSERTWRHLNIPAIAEDGIPDALGREPGVPMDSARDVIDDDGNVIRRDFPAKRRDVGERTWYALYQGSPRSPKGGLFLRSWFDTRLPLNPPAPVAVVVGVDPADTGESDETGIIAASLTANGVVVLTEDWSGLYTAETWARKAVMLACATNAREIALESYTAAVTYTQVLKRAWQEWYAEVVRTEHDGGEMGVAEYQALATGGRMPFTIHRWRAKGRTTDAVARSALMRQAFEVGRCRTVEYKLAVFEEQAADWQTGQHQPDRVSAALIAHDRLVALGGGQMTAASPASTKPGEPPAWMRRRIG